MAGSPKIQGNVGEGRGGSPTGILSALDKLKDACEQVGQAGSLAIVTTPSRLSQTTMFLSEGGESELNFKADDQPDLSAWAKHLIHGSKIHAHTLLYGYKGVGKSTCAMTLWRYLLKTRRLKSEECFLVSASKLLTLYSSAFGKSGSEKARADLLWKLTNTKFLLVTRVDYFCDKQDSLKTFGYLWDMLDEMKKRGGIIIFTIDRVRETDSLESILKKLPEPVVNGVGDFLKLEVPPPTSKARRAILTDFLEKYRGLDGIPINREFSQEELDYLLQIKSVPSMIGETKKVLGGYWRSTDATVDLFQEVSSPITELIDPDAVVKAVESYFKLRSGSLLKKSKSRDVTVPRQIAIRMLYDLCDGLNVALFMKRDRSTISYSLKKIQPEWLEIIEEITKTLTQHTQHKS